MEIKFSRKIGEGGVAEYFFNLCDLIQKKHKEFGIQEYKKYIANQADARVEQADVAVGDLRRPISQVIIERLKKNTRC